MFVCKVKLSSRKEDNRTRFSFRHSSHHLRIRIARSFTSGSERCTTNAEVVSGKLHEATL